ncbi:hypothetical protein [Fundidesulfovibrio terrae]|uniref:hypothetical protein n=1 Tax=Fundidesulfovibrio terrae TaxID=2922866 RepID=UPI001FAFA01A|nr:hypothetical protein [Fundidesulfovibrio terrae]
MERFALCFCLLMLCSCAVYKDKEGQTHYEFLPPPPAVYYAPAPPPAYYAPAPQPYPYGYYYYPHYYYRRYW